MEQKKIIHPFLIYVIDDDRDDFDLLRDIVMEHWPNVRLIYFDDPTAFIAELDKLDIPALVILDINMPKMNGFEVLRHIKNHQRWKEMPCLFLSSSNDPVVKKESQKEGAITYLVKP